MGKKKIEGPITVTVITIDYRRYLELEAAEEKLIAGSTIAGMTEEEYGEATALLVQRVLNNPTVFQGEVECILDRKYRATILKRMSEGNLHSTYVIKFSKV